jgi:epoxyqueuosine reductase
MLRNHRLIFHGHPTSNGTFYQADTSGPASTPHRESSALSPGPPIEDPGEMANASRAELTSTPATPTAAQLDDARRALLSLAEAQGFAAVAVTDISIDEHVEHLDRWLAKNHHGDMQWMATHRDLRAEPQRLFEDTCRVVSVRMNYLAPADDGDPERVLNEPEQAYIARYALGRDYHKLMRQRLKRLAAGLEQQLPGHRYRALVDSAPVLERGFAEKAGLGWIGKNTLLINRNAGSWFFLGEIYTNLPLPVDAPQASQHCGSCQACLDVCPTNAFVGPHQLDARRCISYLTIELRGAIPEPLRPLIGNRVFGCDDCQLVCPWNRFATLSVEADFKARHGLDAPSLLSLFAWTEPEFLQRTAGSPIRRIGYLGWIRNLAVALGNAPYSEAALAALDVSWSINEQRRKMTLIVSS